eukprot:scaffold371108_cov24-Prasinocladus_malaysianus.AAC.1
MSWYPRNCCEISQFLQFSAMEQWSQVKVSMAKQANIVRLSPSKQYINHLAEAACRQHVQQVSNNMTQVPITISNQQPCEACRNAA